MVKGLSHIGNKRGVIGTKTFRTHHSLSGKDNDWLIYEVQEEELDNACELAERAFHHYRKTSKEVRAQFLRTIESNLRQNAVELIKMYCAESSLSEARAKVELNRTCTQLLQFAAYLESNRFPYVLEHEGSNKLRKTLLPIGPIAVFGSSNFPFAYSTIGGDSASALAAGCTVVVKAHPLHAGTGELVANCVIEALKSCDLPEGTFSNLNVQHHTLGARLVQHEKIKGVGFTGSLRGGKALCDLASQRPIPIPFFAEMGSLNPVCIHPSALHTEAEISVWAERYADSIGEASGQFCTKPGILFGVQANLGDSSWTNFCQALKSKLLAREAQPMVHPSLFDAFQKHCEEFENLTGIQALFDDGNSTAAQVKPRLFQTTADQFLRSKEMQQELFGPAALLVSCSSHSEMIACVENLEGQLTASLIYAENQSPSKEVEVLLDSLSQKAGRIILNGVPTGVEVCEAMQHGGPFPATTDSRFTAVGIQSVQRWLRPVVYQS